MSLEVIVLFQKIAHNYTLIFFHVFLTYYSTALYQTKLWWVQIETILTSLDALIDAYIFRVVFWQELLIPMQKDFHALIYAIIIKVGPPLLIDWWNFFL